MKGARITPDRRARIARALRACETWSDVVAVERGYATSRETINRIAAAENPPIVLPSRERRRGAR